MSNYQTGRTPDKGDGGGGGSQTINETYDNGTSGLDQTCDISDFNGGPLRLRRPDNGQLLLGHPSLDEIEESDQIFIARRYDSAYGQSWHIGGHAVLGPNHVPGAHALLIDGVTYYSDEGPFLRGGRCYAVGIEGNGAGIRIGGPLVHEGFFSNFGQSLAEFCRERARRLVCGALPDAADSAWAIDPDRRISASEWRWAWDDYGSVFNGGTTNAVISTAQVTASGTGARVDAMIAAPFGDGAGYQSPTAGSTSTGRASLIHADYIESFANIRRPAPLGWCLSSRIACRGHWGTTGTGYSSVGLFGGTGADADANSISVGMFAETGTVTWHLCKRNAGTPSFVNLGVAFVPDEFIEVELYCQRATSGPGTLYVSINKGARVPVGTSGLPSSGRVLYGASTEARGSSPSANQSRIVLDYLGFGHRL